MTARGIAIILVVIGHYDQGSSLLCHWIMATHYALPPINIAHWMVRQMGIDGRYINLLMGCSLVLAMEAGIVAFINRCCPFMLRLPKKR